MLSLYSRRSRISLYKASLPELPITLSRLLLKRDCAQTIFANSILVLLESSSRESLSSYVCLARYCEADLALRDTLYTKTWIERATRFIWKHYIELSKNNRLILTNIIEKKIKARTFVFAKLKSLQQK